VGNTISVNPSSVWSAHFGSMEVTVDLIVEALIRSEKVIPEEILFVHENRVPYLNLDLLSQDEFASIAAALIESYKAILTDWERHPFDIRDYGYVAQLSVLKAMIVKDVRSNQPIDTSGSITLTSGASWTAPRWIYDFVLENVMASLQSEKRSVFAILLFSQYKTGHCVLNEANHENILRGIVVVLYDRYVVNDYMRVHWIPWFLPALTPHLVSLNEMFISA
jgi:hypothetical protein